MKIIVISDSHFSKSYKLDKYLMRDLEQCDKIIHCGDFTSREFYYYLKETGKLIAVKGNNDFSLPNDVPLVNTVEFEGFKITILHGHTVNITNLHYHYPDSNIVIYGHLHHPDLSEGEDGQIIFSPGSITSNRYVAYDSYAVLLLDNGTKPNISFRRI